MSIGQRLKEARNARNISQGTLASQIGSSRGVISNIEYGLVSDPQPVVINAICETLNINKEWLLTGNGTMDYQPEVFSLDQFIKDRGAGDIEKRVLMGWFSLEPEIRAQVLEAFKESFADDLKEPAANLTYQELQNIYDNLPKTPEEFEKLYPPVPVEEIDGKKDAG